jgi:hypothetical protein
VTLKKTIAKRLIPASMKWESVVKGIAKLYAAIYEEIKKANDRTSLEILGDAAYRVGYDFGESLKERFELGDSLDDIEFAFKVEHQIFGIKSKVAEKTSNELVFHNHECQWSKYFTPPLCIAIGEAEKGIA